MKIKSKLISFFLVTMMLLSFSMVTYADETTMTLKIADATAEPGDTVILPVELIGNTGISVVNMTINPLPTGIKVLDVVVDWDEYNDANGTDYDYRNGLLTGYFGYGKTTQKLVWANNTDKKGDRPLFYIIASVDADAANGEYPISIRKTDGSQGMLADLDKDLDEFVAMAPGVITVTGAAEAADYTVSLSGDQSIAMNEQASVAVSVDSSKYSDFATLDMTVSYDAEALKYEGIDNPAYYVNANTPGVLRIHAIGENKAVPSGFVLNFSGLKVTDGAEVEITSAFVDCDDNEFTDAPAAQIVGSAASIAVTGYSVTLGDYLEGSSIAAPETDYTFSAVDYANYDYVITATVGDTDVSGQVIDNGNGTYTIPGELVINNIVISAERTAKAYSVTFEGEGATDATGDATATYSADYTFTLTEDADYSYSVSMTIGGAAYTGFGKNEDVYTIPGTDITGNIVITITKTLIPPTEVTVTFDGNGAGDATGEPTATIGEDYTFSLAKDAGYAYTINAVSGEAAIDVIDNEDGTYTIAGADVNDNITITITKEMSVEVSAHEYVKLDEKSIFLVLATGALDEGSVYTYDGNTMYWSDAYDAYAYLVITDAAFNGADATANIVIAEGTATSVVYDGDVNETGKVDINDAQVVYNMYNGKYQSFDDASMSKFLKADMNADFTLNVQDATTIIALL